MSEHVLPHNLEAEKSVLGAVLIANDALDLVGGLEPRAFYRTAHQQIFAAMRDLHHERVAVDFTTLQAKLEQQGTLESVGGMVYISGLLDGLPHATNIEHYARIIREKSALRDLVSIGVRLQQQALEAEQSALDVAAAADASLMRLTGANVSGDLVSASSMMTELMTTLDDAYRNKRAIVGLQTDWRELDEITLGLNASDLIVIAARPGVGKTVMGANLALTVAQSQPVAFFTLEMSRQQIALRMLAAHAGVSLYRMRSGYIVDSDWQHISRALEQLGSSGLYIDETPGITVTEVRAKCRRMQRQHGLALVVIDYLQLMRGVGSFSNRTQEVGSISRGLKSLAKELSVPVVALCQLSRKPESREGGRPQLSDLRESGDIEQDADLVWLLHRPELYQQTPESEGLTYVYVDKQRNGPTGTAKLRFHKDLVRFETWTEFAAASAPRQREFSV